MIRLINIHTHDIQSFDDRFAPPYAIASHRWYGDSEISYEDFTLRRRTNTDGHLKVIFFCALVKTVSQYMSLMLGCALEWVWIDTCCIKKSDSSELSEAINSMFDWYARAKVCFAYLSDVDAKAHGTNVMQSSWFGRGWTLQELLAPSLVIFIDGAWNICGHKQDGAFEPFADMPQQSQMEMLGPDLSVSISSRTGIPVSVLKDLNQLYCADIETVLSWMDTRFTSRQEDQAYCLLGLLDVPMSLIYGEKEFAMVRLLEQVQLKYERELKSLAPDVLHTRAGKPVTLLQQELSLLNGRMLQLHDARFRRRAQDRRLVRPVISNAAPKGPLKGPFDRSLDLTIDQWPEMNQWPPRPFIDIPSPAITSAEFETATSEPQHSLYDPPTPPSYGKNPSLNLCIRTNDDGSAEQQPRSHPPLLPDPAPSDKLPTTFMFQVLPTATASISEQSMEQVRERFMAESISSQDDQQEEEEELKRIESSMAQFPMAMSMLNRPMPGVVLDDRMSSSEAVSARSGKLQQPSALEHMSKATQQQARGGEVLTSEDLPAARQLCELEAAEADVETQCLSRVASSATHHSMPRTGAYTEVALPFWNPLRQAARDERAGEGQ